MRTTESDYRDLRSIIVLLIIIAMIIKILSQS